MIPESEPLDITVDRVMRQIDAFLSTLEASEGTASRSEAQQGD